MLRFWKSILALGLMVGSIETAQAFSLLGVWDAWQTTQLGYRKTVGGIDIGGPMNLSEEYRWNVPIITYAFDESFLNYFGARGVAEVEKAIQMLNDIPAVSQMSSNLSEFPLESTRVNYRAQALGILDLKSHALMLLTEELGLAEPERYVWTLRDRQTYTVNNVTITNYLVIQRNFDPVTWEPSKLVNGAMYSYSVVEPILPGNFAEAIEFSTDPLNFYYSSVASGILGPGQFYVAMTRDDIGGIRYMYRYANYNVENLPTGITNGIPGGSGGGYVIWFPTNFVGQTNWGGSVSNVTIDVGLRPGIEKITFQRVDYDSLLGQTLVPYYYDYTDTVITNFQAVQQYVRRSITDPDILFVAEDLGVTTGGLGTPIIYARTAGFVSNDAINGQTTKAGPGVIQGPLQLSFTYLIPGYLNDDSFLDETTASRTSIWGSYDGTTNAPIVYPNLISIRDLERQVGGY